MKKIVLTGDRPTGRLHLGHYVGSLKQRVLLQLDDSIDEIYIMIADGQAITDHFDKTNTLKKNIIELCLDYLSVGIDPKKCTIFIQSQVPALFELTFYYANLVTLSRLKRNPTVKHELKLRGFEQNIPVGFLAYPISQAADITAFDGSIVPVGKDQLPMIEQTREIVRTFNSIYGDTLVEPEALLSKNAHSARLPGIDGKEKMGKSLNNAIFLSDDREVLQKKVMQMYTDPSHIRVEDPGNTDNNPVFMYLDVFCKDEHFEKYLKDYKNLDEFKEHYRRGGLGDVKVKKFLFSVLDDFLTPIRERREKFKKDEKNILNILQEGSAKANKKANEVLRRVKKAMHIDY